jgi:hypothetical protein
MAPITNKIINKIFKTRKYTVNTNNITPSGAKELPTTDIVESPIGQLRFEGGYPSKETIEKLYDQLDLQRAAQAYLDGGQNYRLRLPAGIPAKNFWSVTVYDTETRSLLQNGQPKPSISSAFDQPEVNPDDSVDIYFGPAAPEGKEKNWIRDGARTGPLRLDPPVRSAGALLRADLETRRHS